MEDPLTISMREKKSNGEEILGEIKIELEKLKD